MKNNIKINSDFQNFINVFLDENHKHNLISRNDETYLYEKHIYDSLGIKLFFEKYGTDFKTILDIGCGGGFPCIPISIEYPDFQVTGIDSIKKKINAVTNIKNTLKLNNLNLICDRAENLKNIKTDIIISRAVADLSKISEYAYPFMNKNSYFIAYKSKRAEEEILNAAETLKKLGLQITDIINYTLPTKEVHERKLICIKKV